MMKIQNFSFFEKSIGLLSIQQILSILFPSFFKHLFCRTSPLVDVPEVNTGIVLRTIQKSSNDENDEISVFGYF